MVIITKEMFLFKGIVVVYFVRNIYTYTEFGWL